MLSFNHPTSNIHLIKSAILARWASAGGKEREKAAEASLQEKSPARGLGHSRETEPSTQPGDASGDAGYEPQAAPGAACPAAAARSPRPARPLEAV